MWLLKILNYYVFQHWDSPDSEEYSNNSKWVKGLPESRGCGQSQASPVGTVDRDGGWAFWEVDGGADQGCGLAQGARSEGSKIRGDRVQMKALGSGWE